MNGGVFVTLLLLNRTKTKSKLNTILFAETATFSFRFMLFICSSIMEVVVVDLRRSVECVIIDVM